MADCSICYEVCTGPKKLICGHVFCTGCIKEWYLKSDEPACPMCRGPLYFRGFLRSGWREEKEGKVDDDETFIRVFDWMISDRFSQFEEEDLIPDEYDLNELMWDLGDVQQTYNTLKLHYNASEDEIEDVIYNDYRTMSFFNQKYIWVDEPPKPQFTRYPQIV